MIYDVSFRVKFNAHWGVKREYYNFINRPRMELGQAGSLIGPATGASTWALGSHK
jgi:hypothetical protein